GVRLREMLPVVQEAVDLPDLNAFFRMLQLGDLGPPEGHRLRIAFLDMRITLAPRVGQGRNAVHNASAHGRGREVTGGDFTQARQTFLGDLGARGRACGKCQYRNAGEEMPAQTSVATEGAEGAHYRSLSAVSRVFRIGFMM